jgi:cytochrome c biogenesis protein CcmG, thiol:disulfide interchange protein DsbE
MNVLKSKLGLLILGLSVSLLLAWLLMRGPGVTEPVNEGQPAPDFRFKDQAGKELSLSAFRGKVVLVNFWATWCSPCREEMPSMEALGHQTDPEQLKILALSVDDSWASVNEFMRQAGLALPVYADFDKRISSQYGTFKFPETYIVDRKGKVVLKVIGATDWTAPTMIAYLQKLLAESPT